MPKLDLRFPSAKSLKMCSTQSTQSTLSKAGHEQISTRASQVGQSHHGRGSRLGPLGPLQGQPVDMKISTMFDMFWHVLKWFLRILKSKFSRFSGARVLTGNMQQWTGLGDRQAEPPINHPLCERSARGQAWISAGWSTGFAKDGDSHGFTPIYAVVHIMYVYIYTYYISICICIYLCMYHTIPPYHYQCHYHNHTLT